MKSTFLIAALFTSSFLASNAFAGDDEHMEVTAPNECCAALPSGLGMLTGWGPTSSSGMGAVTLAAAATRANKTTVKKAREKKAKQPPEQTPKTPGIFDRIISQLSITFQIKVDVYKDGKPVGSLQACQGAASGGVENPCEIVKREQFIDPTDGMEKFVTTIAVVNPVYNPKHVDADSSGWYPQIVTGQALYIIHQTDSEFYFELNKALEN